MGGAGVPDIAAGKVDVAIAESGISLRLQLAPILSANAEREQNMLGVYDQMFFDILNMWLPAYEGTRVEAEIGTLVGDPLPKNREAQVKEIMDLKTAGIITAEEARTKLIELGGYEIEAKSDALVAETQAMAAASDTFNKRVDAELNGEQSEGAATDPAGAPA